MSKHTNKTRKPTNSTFRKDMGDIATGVAKELVLVGIYGAKELTGIDMHHKPRPAKRSWEKKWGEL